jgi:nucleotide-binding universal stress UspA family protein
VPSNITIYPIPPKHPMALFSPVATVRRRPFTYREAKARVMTFVVPFDGAARTTTALERAREFGTALDEDLLVVTVIPVGNAAYARQRGWLASDEPFDLRAIVSTLSARVEEIAPEATFEYERCSRSVTGNSIAKPIRKFAKRHDAEMVFVGSDRAGRLMTTASSVGGRIAADGAYDVVLVRNR